MLKRVCLLLSLFIVLPTVGSDHIALSLKNKGIKNLLISIITHYRQGHNKSIVILPKENYKGIVKKEHINNNPIIKKLKSMVEIDFSKDLNFHVKWEPITIEAKLVENKLDIETIGKGQSFDTLFKIDIEELSIKGSKVEFCEFENLDKTCNTKDGMYGRFEDFELSLNSGELIQALIKTNVSVKDDKVKIKFIKLISNLIGHKTKLDKLDMDRFGFDGNPPEFYLNFNEFYMPPPILTINGTRIELDISKIKETLLSEREFLSNLLTNFAGGFIAEDLVELVNKKIISKIDEIKTQYRLIDIHRYKNRQEKFLELADVDPGAAIVYLKNYGEIENRELSFAETLSKIFRRKISQAQNNLYFTKIQTYSGQDLTAYFDSDLQVNSKDYEVTDDVWNGQKKLAPINFSSISSDYEFAFALSEPLINSILNAGSSSGIISSIFSEFTKMKGVYLDDVNFHLISNDKNCALDRIKVVANMRVRLSEIEREGWLDYIKLSLGEYLEADGWLLPSEEDLYFPVEVDLSAIINHIDGKSVISISADSPFRGKELQNTFDYPIKDMNNLVKNGLYDKLRESIQPHINEVHDIDISDYLNAVPGVKLNPKGLFASESGHFVITFNIDEIDLDELGRLNEK